MGRFAQMLRADDVAVVGGAYDALTAKLVEEAGFCGVWLGSFSLATQQLLPDAGLITATDMATAVRSVAQATALPVIVDAETGYGDALNVAHAVSQFQRAGAAAVCIEDNAPPKRSSLYRGAPRALLDPTSMERKIAAAIAARGDGDIAIIARTEALIVDGNAHDAAKRARAYAAAGADAVVIQAARWADIEAVCRLGYGPAPLVLIPTLYPEVSRATLTRYGVRVAIYANHALRAAVRALRPVLRALATAGETPDLAVHLATIDEINQLVGLTAWLGQCGE